MTESVWDYPRPPRVESCTRRVRIVLDGETIVDSDDCLRVLETTHPPTIYVPTSDIRLVLSDFSLTTIRSYCEWKGEARYVDIRNRKDAAWFYPNPTDPYSMLFDHWSFYPSQMDECYLDDERVTAQPGDFYGGWITSDIKGPFKGGAGTGHW